MSYSHYVHGFCHVCQNPDRPLDPDRPADRPPICLSCRSTFDAIDRTASSARAIRAEMKAYGVACSGAVRHVDRFEDSGNSASGR